MCVEKSLGQMSLPFPPPFAVFGEEIKAYVEVLH